MNATSLNICELTENQAMFSSGIILPEIVDPTVFFHAHNKEIGNKLLDVSEQ